MRDESYAQRSVSGGAVIVSSPLLEGLAGAGEGPDGAPGDPPIRHGFGTRLGGVSEGTLASLNFGLKGGDRPENVRENLRRLGLTVGFDPDRCCRLHQVHGIDVVRALEPATLLGRAGDALISAEPGVTIGVVTADCVPVLFADRGRRAVGAAHAGWRGLAGGVLEATIASLGEHFGIRPRELLCAIGPCIGPCCYEVGEEVAARFDAGAVLRGRGPRPHLDLAQAARVRLRAAGVPEAQISEARLCTRCRDDLFYSYRREGAATGHHLSVIGVG